jgi:hypothetical protein
MGNKASQKIGHLGAEGQQQAHIRQAKAPERGEPALPTRSLTKRANTDNHKAQLFHFSS